MLKRKSTILLTGIMCFSSVSGLFSVICHGSNGHVAVKSLFYSHCKCPESDAAGIQNNFSESVIELSTDHNHCRDTLVTSNLVVPARKNIKLPTHEVIAVSFLLKPISSYTASFSGDLSAWCTEFSSFFMPLRTVILLA